MLKWSYYIFVVCVLSLSLSGCGKRVAPYITLQGSLLGTTYHVKAQLPNGTKELERRVVELGERMTSEMSIFDPTSLVSRINRGESDSLTVWLEQNICLADSISRLSGGVYDITVAPLVEAWGFGRGEGVERPNIDSLLEFVGYEGLSIKDGRLVKRDERMQIDLNSIAKGFAVDRLAEIVEVLGAQNYIVDIGGELRLRGVNASGNGWRVGVESPIDGNMSEGEYLERRIEITADSPLKGMATSGNYRRFHLSAEGEKVVHTIDPTTGMARPSTLLSVTVLAPTCAEADAYATMLMAAGDQRAETLAKEIENCEVYLIYNSSDDESNYREYMSEGMRQRLLD